MEKFENDFEYSVENEKATITKYTGSDKTLIVPEKLGAMKLRVLEKLLF